MSQILPGHDPSAPETPMVTVGRRGLDLVHPLDQIDPQGLSRMVNLRAIQGGPLEVRPGETALGTTTGVEHVHSVVRLNDPAAGSFTRLGGSTTKIYRGQTGAFTLIDSNYSGDPLTFAATTAATTGVPYILVGDRSRNRKISRTGASEPIGAPPQTNACSVTVAAENTTSFCRFDAADTSAAASWTLTAGTDTAGTGTGAPTATDVGNAVAFTTDPTGAAAGLGYYSTVSIARTVNAAVLQGGLYAATDDDLMNLRITTDRPDYLEEIRVYWVLGAFTAGIIPGTSATQNHDAYWKSFGPSTFATYLDLLGQPASQTVATLGDAVRATTLREQFKADQEAAATANADDPLASRPRPTATVGQAQTDLPPTVIPELVDGRNVQTVYGIVGNPLRRGEFSRLGSDATLSWSTVTGLVIVLRTKTNQPIVVTCDDWRLTGGGGPDTTDPTALPYDFRVTNYNPATGDEGNPSPIMAITARVDALRQPLNIGPASGSNVATTWRQRFYRRGGLPQTSDNWYYDGVNSSDGGVYQTYLADTEVLTQGTLEIDNDQPVTSTDSGGNTVLAKVVPIYFAIGDYMFALGDTNQPQRLYRSKQGNSGAWPATEYEDVCAAGDELMNGGQWGASGFTLTRNRLYQILINDLDGTWTTEPTPCAEGLVGRWAFAVTPFGIAFVSPFGVRLTTGGTPLDLSGDQIGPLFRGLTVNGFAPIDLTVPTALKLAYGDNELWLTYADTGGVRRQLIYHFLDKTWRSYLFGTTVSCAYFEPVQGAASSILLGSFSAGAIYTHDGFSDLGAAIAFTARTGAQDFGQPAAQKLFTQVRLTAEIFTGTLTAQAFLNDEQTTDTAQAVVGTAGLQAYSYEPFGTAPQQGRNVSVELRGSASTSARPYFNLLGATYKLQPEVVFNQPTPWEELPGGEGYCWGCILTFDTGGQTLSAVVEYTANDGAITTAATLSVSASGRKKIPYSWGSVLAQQIRLRPTGTCVPWVRYKTEWLTDAEPPRVPGWDTNWQEYGTLSDKWIKGYLIEADTFNVAKTVVLDIDQSNAANSQSLTFNGRGIQHIAFARLKGRLFRFRATDTNYGKLYKIQPIFDEEPLALTRWEMKGITHSRTGWSKPLAAWVALLSGATVTLTVTAYNASGTTLDTSAYTISSTGSVKQRRYVKLNPVKGVIFDYVFTCASAFTLYREEGELEIEDWMTGQSGWVPAWGNDDLIVPPRGMGNAEGIAGASYTRGVPSGGGGA